MTILITGGTKGIGLAIARRLARPGRRLVLAYLSDAEAAAAAEAQLQPSGAMVSTVRADVGSLDDVRRLIGLIAPDDEPLHIVHSAAMIYPTALLDADLDRFGEAMKTNGLSLLYLVQTALPRLSRGSSVVLISSAGARAASANYAALGVGKAMAESLMRYLVPELAPRGVRINGVAPGIVATTSVASMVGGEEAAARVLERAARTNPSGRLGGDDDYAGVVEFLLSDAAAFVQGQVIHANGGAYVQS
ncbi:SDR family NAD(P)-dependent oxidoreductase [Phenylobacterium sp.]|uniref:SDR family NAD(P)-dependent oxidoreductase n=1 Tax=Phenylobacterium sp. TaxID=1871053 RepID=UPI00374DCBC0